MSDISMRNLPETLRFSVTSSGYFVVSGLGYSFYVAVTGSAGRSRRRRKQENSWLKTFWGIITFKNAKTLNHRGFSVDWSFENVRNTRKYQIIPGQRQNMKD